MSILIAILVIVATGSLSAQLVRNNERSAQRHRELVELLKGRENTGDSPGGE